MKVTLSPLVGKIASMMAAPRPATHLFLLAATLLQPASAWIATSQLWSSNASGLWRPEQIALRVGAVSGLWDNSILSAGLSYAWDPQLCPQLLGRFSDGVFIWPFISCDDLRASMSRAFAVWEANHPAIR